jgi:hypothetical protein
MIERLGLICETSLIMREPSESVSVASMPWVAHRARYCSTWSNASFWPIMMGAQISHADTK